jgi:hypothetical protein
VEHHARILDHIFALLAVFAVTLWPWLPPLLSITASVMAISWYAHQFYRSWRDKDKNPDV